MTDSALLELRIAMAHLFVQHGANLSPERCLVCGLNVRDPVHATKNIERQRKRGDSRMAAVVMNRRELQP